MIVLFLLFDVFVILISFRCKCDHGICGSDCNVADPCIDKNICANGGVCIEKCVEYSDYMCNCTEGYAGKNCSEIVSSFLILIIVLVNDKEANWEPLGFFEQMGALVWVGK